MNLNALERRIKDNLQYAEQHMTVAQDCLAKKDYTSALARAINGSTYFESAGCEIHTARPQEREQHTRLQQHFYQGYVKVLLAHARYSIRQGSDLDITKLRLEGLPRYAQLAQIDVEKQRQTLLALLQKKTETHARKAKKDLKRPLVIDP